MSINLEKLSFDELKKLGRDVQKAISGFEERRRKEALKALEQVAKNFGFSVDDIVRTKPAKGRKAKAPAKFKNPKDPSQTWSGRGRQPAWYKEALAAGKSEKDLKI